MEAYSGFAEVYDLFMDDVPYEEWKEFLTDTLQEEGICDGLVCELGCGTGRMTRLLAQSGYDMIGIDVSEEMLSIAREAQSEGILYLAQDMCEFELYGTVRAVVSVCDSINYLTSEEDLLDIYAIGQCTPGVIAVNTATFIGQKNKGVPGGILATLGVVFPSLVIISLLAGVITAFSHLAWVSHAFGGIRVCVCVLILNAVAKLYKKSVVDKPTFAICFLVFGLSAALSCSPVWFVLASALAGILIKNLGVRKA